MSGMPPQIAFTQSPNTSPARGNRQSRTREVLEPARHPLAEGAPAAPARSPVAWCRASRSDTSSRIGAQHSSGCACCACCARGWPRLLLTLSCLVHAPLASVPPGPQEVRPTAVVAGWPTTPDKKAPGSPRGATATTPRSSKPRRLCLVCVPTAALCLLGRERRGGATLAVHRPLSLILHAHPLCCPRRFRRSPSALLPMSPPPLFFPCRSPPPPTHGRPEARRIWLAKVVGQKGQAETDPPGARSRPAESCAHCHPLPQGPQPPPRQGQARCQTPRLAR